MEIRDTNQIGISDKDKNESPGGFSLCIKPAVVSDKMTVACLLLLLNRCNR